MPDFFVNLDNEESNELADTLSITGTVNAAQCAARLRLSALEGLSPSQGKREKQKALIQAYLQRSERVTAGAERVSL